MTNQEYPYNLIRAIYNDDTTDDTHVDQVDITSLYRTLELMPDNERIVLLGRYRDGKTFKESGRSAGETSASSVQTARKALRRMRRYGRHNYYTINPETGLAYTLEEIEPYIGELKLQPGTENALIDANHATIEQVRRLSEEQLKSFRNFGEKHYQDFVEKLDIYEKEHGLSPVPKATYPTNLIHAIRDANKNDDTLHPDDVDETLNKLTRQERLFVTLKYKDGLTINELSKQVGLPTGNINQTVWKALIKMNPHLQNKPVKTVTVAPKPKQKPEPQPQIKKIYPFNLLTQVFGRDDDLKSVYVQGFHDEVDNLPDTYRQYVQLHYEFGLTRVACSKRMSLSIYQIEQLEMQVHRKLRDKKDDGFLTATPTISLAHAKQQVRELERENRAYKHLISAIAAGTIKPESLDIHEPPTEDERTSPLLSLPIEELDLSVRAQKALTRNRWDTLGHLTSHTLEELAALRNIGVSVVNEIVETLSNYGLTLKDQPTDKQVNQPKRNPLTPSAVSEAEKGLRGEKLIIEIESE